MRRAYLYFTFGALFLVPALLLHAPGIAKAEARDPRAMSEGEYREALAFLEGTRAAMTEAEMALDAETAHEAAKVRKADLGQRLDMLRRLMTAAAQRDRIGAKSMITPERERARDVIRRAGEMEDPLQDLWTVWAMRARGERAAFTVAPLPR